LEEVEVVQVLSGDSCKQVVTGEIAGSVGMRRLTQRTEQVIELEARRGKSNLSKQSAGEANNSTQQRRALKINGKLTKSIDGILDLWF
jgi:hypothetical protein